MKKGQRTEQKVRNKRIKQIRTKCNNKLGNKYCKKQQGTRKEGMQNGIIDIGRIYTRKNK